MLAFAGVCGVRISALTGEGIDTLRTILCEALNLTDWNKERASIFTGRQREACENALSVLSADSGDPAEAVERLRFVVSDRVSPEDCP